MRVFCGEMHPGPYGLTPRAAERPVPTRVRLSWSRILVTPGTRMELSVDEQDEHYLLYQACIEHLRVQYSPSSLTSALKKRLKDRLSNFPPSFGILVNLLADRYPKPDTDSISSEGLLVMLNHSSVVDFILCGMLAVTVTLNCKIITYDLPAPEDIPASDLYQAFFLDIITSLWDYECYWRKNLEWSPMPWSRTSLKELSASNLIIDDDYIECELAEEDGPAFHVAQSMFGCPEDVPWFGAHHDGYPFCSTLSSYTKIRQDGFMHSIRDDAALWVSAMTFGLLEAVVGASIPERLLLITTIDEDGTPRSILSGTRILRLIAHWTSYFLRLRFIGTGRSIKNKKHLKHGREVAHLLHKALAAIDEEGWECSSLFIRAGYRGAPRVEMLHMTCAVTVTVVSLCEAAHFVWDMLPEMDRVYAEVGDKLRNFYNAVTTSCRVRMCCEARWCPSVISYSFISTLPDILTISRLVRIPPYIRKKPDEHWICCYTSTCVFYTITNTDTYVPQHIDPTCSCEYTKPPLDDVVRLLSKGTVPAVVYDGTRLRVQPAEDNTYVAISHVWADGLGSTTEVGLPTCQISRLAALVRQVRPESDGAFWMDSLCVPDIKDLRKRAIKLMANTYRDAATVLVIDACIRSQCSKARSWDENLLYIATSGWMRRVWTLQEGLLARTLYFEFVDGPIDVEEGLYLRPNAIAAPQFIEELSRNPIGARRLQSLSHTPLFAQRTRNMFCKSREASTLLEGVITLLWFRTTSKAEDEIIAISGLLPSVNIDRLLAITGPNAAALRMKDCLLQLRKIPRRLVTHPVARLDFPGFRWAPSSFTQAIQSSLPKDRAPAICTEDGLVGDFLLVAFDKPVFMASEDQLPGGRFRVILIRPASDTLYNLRVHTATNTTPFDALLIVDEDLSKPAIQCATVRWTDAPGPPAAEKGIDSPLRLSYFAPAELDRLSKPPDDYPVIFPDTPVMGPLRQTNVLLT